MSLSRFACGWPPRKPYRRHFKATQFTLTPSESDSSRSERVRGRPSLLTRPVLAGRNTARLWRNRGVWWGPVDPYGTKGKKGGSGKPREGTHKAEVIAMLQRKGGATL